MNTEASTNTASSTTWSHAIALQAQTDGAMQMANLYRRAAEAPDCIHATGFNVLIKLYAPIKRRDSLIELPQDAAELHGKASIMSQVMELGPDAYVSTDQRPWPSGPYCRPGDWVICRSYTGTRMKIDGAEYRLVNDDQIQAVISDPERVERAV